MKMNLYDYEMLQKAILDHLHKAGYNIQSASDVYKLQGYSMMRFRWDMFHAVNVGPKQQFRYLSKYLKDDHIDTALRKITNTK